MAEDRTRANTTPCDSGGSQGCRGEPRKLQYELHADSAIKLRTWLCSRREPEVSRDVKLERLEGRNSNVSSPAPSSQDSKNALLSTNRGGFACAIMSLLGGAVDMHD